MDIVPATYQPPPAEKRREIARKAAEEVCGPLASNLLLVETTGGVRGASYTATWKRLLRQDAPAWAEVSLSSEAVTHVRCNPEAPTEPVDSVFRRMSRAVLGSLAGLVVLALLGALLVYFGVGQCHRSPILWKRLPLAVLLGLPGTWVLSPAFFASPPAIPVRLVGGLAASALFLVGLVAVEHQFLRRAPTQIATWILALGGRLLHPAVPLAVIRGMLGGLGLAAVETLLVQGSGALPGGRATLFFGFFVDPAPVGHALVSLSPPLFVISSAYFHGLALGMIVVGLAWLEYSRQFAKVGQRVRGVELRIRALTLSLSMAFYVGAAIIALRLHIGTLMAPGFGLLPASVLLGWLAWLLVKYFDVLTVVIAVATAVLWTLNYTLLHILRDVGNGAHWAIFAGWAALVLAAAVIVFRPQIRQYVKAAIE